MSGWKTIDELDRDRYSPVDPEKYAAPRPRIDLYSASRHIRWPDCLWWPSEGCWYSRHVFCDEQGRRTTQFIQVFEPTHWMPMPDWPSRSNDPDPVAA